MIAYKWVIKKGNKFYPIVNNGAYYPFNNLDLGYYEKGNIIEKFINPWDLIKRKTIKPDYDSFHRAGFHFWIRKNNPNKLKSFRNCMKRYNKTINCILTCKIEKSDIVIQDNHRLIANKFKIITEEVIK